MFWEKQNNNNNNNKQTEKLLKSKNNINMFLKTEVQWKRREYRWLLAAVTHLPPGYF